MSDKAVLCTGAGGFLGRYILEHYLDKEDCALYLLENGTFGKRLEDFLDARPTEPKQRERIKVFDGDISKPGLGIEKAMADELKERVTHALHLAALYNLAAPRDISMKVNVDGTRNVLDFLAEVRNFQRLAYTSTIAVAGTFSGTFKEDELDVGQGFENYYAETKFLAEKVVQERRDTLPTVILRPTSVVGHSRTGAIEKIDGAYYGLTMIARNMHLIIPNTGANKFHFGPVDFIADAIYYLFEDDESVGKVFHLVDPAPPTYIEFFNLASERMGKRKPLLKAPPGLLKLLFKVPVFQKLTGVPLEAFNYSLRPIEYDTTNAAPALEKHGVSCPPIASYIDVMIEYFHDHSADPGIRKGDWKQGTT